MQCPPASSARTYTQTVLQLHWNINVGPSARAGLIAAPVLFEAAVGNKAQSTAGDMSRQCSGQVHMTSTNPEQYLHVQALMHHAPNPTANCTQQMFTLRMSAAHCRYGHDRRQQALAFTDGKTNDMQPLRVEPCPEIKSSDNLTCGWVIDAAERQVSCRSCSSDILVVEQSYLQMTP